MPVQNVGVLFAKGLKAVMRNAFDEEPDILEKFIPNVTSSMAYEEWTARVGPGVAELKQKGQEFIEKDIIIKTPKRVTHNTWGVQVRVPFEDVDDDLYNAAKADAKDAGRSIKSRMAWERAMMLNTSFITAYITGYDGKAICATDHPLDIPRYPYATTNLTSEPTRTTYTWSNKLATASDFDFVAYNDAIVLLRRTPSWEGDPMEIGPEYVLGGPENQVAFDEVLKSTERPDTANNAINALKDYGVSRIISNRFLDTDAWWVAVGPSRHDFKFFVRMAMKIKTNYDPATWDWLTQAAARFSNGIFDPRGVVGTPGA